MFQLDFFETVKRVCDTEPWTNTYANFHESYVMKKKDNPYTKPLHNKMLIEYIQYTYLPYFEIQLRYPHTMVNNSNHLTKGMKQELFFE